MPSIFKDIPQDANKGYHKTSRLVNLCSVTICILNVYVFDNREGTGYLKRLKKDIRVKPVSIWTGLEFFD